MDIGIFRSGGEVGGGLIDTMGAEVAEPTLSDRAKKV